MVSTSCQQSHPQEPEILAWVEGGSLSDSVRAHLEDCGACRLRAERVRAQISELRQVAAELPDANAAPAAKLPARNGNDLG
jgi:hypothetical protein